MSRSVYLHKEISVLVIVSIKLKISSSHLLVQNKSVWKGESRDSFQVNKIYRQIN